MKAKQNSSGGVLSALSMSLAAMLTGFGIGWLIGLSASPVVSIVITSVVGSAAAVVAAMGGLEHREGQKVSPWPVALLLLGLLLGSATGLRVRNENLLGQNVKGEIERWHAAGLKMEDTDIAQRLFDISYPAAITAADKAPVNAPSSASTRETLLFAVSYDECATFKALEGDELRTELGSSPNLSLRPLANLIGDPVALKQIVEVVICADYSSQ